MSHHPYPDVARALRQLNRHRQPAPVVELECLRPIGEAIDRLRVNTRRAAGQGFGLKVGEYRLSTRPRVVGGPP